jgi:hypothetical protein
MVRLTGAGAEILGELDKTGGPASAIGGGALITTGAGVGGLPAQATSKLPQPNSTAVLKMNCFDLISPIRSSPPSADVPALRPYFRNGMENRGGLKPELRLA